MKKNWKVLSSGALALALISVTGCEAVQGYEFGQALQNNASMTSGESKGTMAIELVPGTGGNLSNDEKSVLDVLHNLKITIKDTKMQDPQHVSVDAEFTYSKGTIPFKLFINNNEMIISIEGAQKPIVFNTNPTGKGSTPAFLSESLRQDLQKKIIDFVPAAAKFFISNAPNPDHISLSQTQEQVNNETLTLQKLHTEIYGDELAGLVKKFLTNVVADEKGLKELLGQLYDALVPTIKASLEAMREQEKQLNPDSTSTNPMDMYLNNKTLAVEFAYTSIQQGLQSVLKDYDKNIEDSKAAASGTPLDKLLSKEAYAKFDLFIDKDQWIRKQNVELQIPLDGDTSPISAIKVTASSDTWNNNKPVTSDKIDLSAGKLEIGGANPFKAYTFLGNLDKTSQLYKLLKDDLQITKKQITLNLADTGMDAIDETQPFIDSNGVAMVPARYVTEQFGAEVQWNAEQQEITIIDNLTGTPVVFKIGSNTAVVKGSQVQLESPAILKNGSTYVPLRFLSDALGGKLDWNDSTHTIHISRD
jgi:hypothetical protein